MLILAEAFGGGGWFLQLLVGWIGDLNVMN